MSAAVLFHPMADGPAVAEHMGRPLRMGAHKLGLHGIAAAMDIDACTTLERLDALVSELSAMTHGYAIALEQPWAKADRDTRLAVRDLQNDIANYQQWRCDTSAARER